MISFCMLTHSFVMSRPNQNAMGCYYRCLPSDLWTFSALLVNNHPQYSKIPKMLWKWRATKPTRSCFGGHWAPNLWGQTALYGECPGVVLGRPTDQVRVLLDSTQLTKRNIYIMSRSSWKILQSSKFLNLDFCFFSRTGWFVEQLSTFS